MLEDQLVADELAKAALAALLMLGVVVMHVDAFELSEDAEERNEPVEQHQEPKPTERNNTTCWSLRCKTLTQIAGKVAMACGLALAGRLLALQICSASGEASDPQSGLRSAVWLD